MSLLARGDGIPALGARAGHRGRVCCGAGGASGPARSVVAGNRGGREDAADPGRLHSCRRRREHTACAAGCANPGYPSGCCSRSHGRWRGPEGAPTWRAKRNFLAAIRARCCAANLQQEVDRGNPDATRAVPRLVAPFPQLNTADNRRRSHVAELALLFVAIVWGVNPPIISSACSSSRRNRTTSRVWSSPAPSRSSHSGCRGRIGAPRGPTSGSCFASAPSVSSSSSSSSPRASSAPPPATRPSSCA